MYFSALSPHSKTSDVQKHPVNTLSPYLLSLFSFFVCFFFLVSSHCTVCFSENDGRTVGKETEVTPKDLFFFLTGSDRIPPMGFDKKGTIVFDHRENTRENRLPSVSTCLPQLRLPVCDSLTEDYDVFKEQMNLAVLGSVGFGDL